MRKLGHREVKLLAQVTQLGDCKAGARTIAPRSFYPFSLNPCPLASLNHSSSSSDPAFSHLPACAPPAPSVQRPPFPCFLVNSYPRPSLGPGSSCSGSFPDPSDPCARCQPPACPAMGCKCPLLDDVPCQGELQGLVTAVRNHAAASAVRRGLLSFPFHRFRNDSELGLDAR